MNRLVLLLALVLMAVPVFAQESGAGDGGFGGLFGMGDAPRGNNAPPPDRLVQLRKILLDVNVPLTKDQEKSLSSMLEKDIKQYTAELEKKYPAEVAQARAAASAGPAGGDAAASRAALAAGGGRPGGRGGRGGGIPAGSPLRIEMDRINAELQNKVTAALKPEQQAAFKKFQNDQVKKAGGFGALKLIMHEAGAALTSDQETQIQALYTEEAQQRQQMMRESQGQPDKAKLDALTNGTMLKVTRILNADQKKFFLEALKKRQQ